MKDVADVMETVAFGALHTPSLYSCFLRALISAKTEPTEGALPMQQLATSGMEGTVDHDHSVVATANSAALGTISHSTGVLDPLSEFQFDGEMGPVADISTFPPTMAPHSDDHLGMLSIDTILSTSFWDNVLVPGKCPADGIHHHRSHSL